MIFNLPFKPRLPAWIGEVSWRTLAGAAFLGGAVHICVTFAAPLVGAGNAFQQLRATLPLNRVAARSYTPTISTPRSKSFSDFDAASFRISL